MFLRKGFRTIGGGDEVAVDLADVLIGWGLRLLAWAFATLFVAGFTNAVRKT